MYWTTLIALDSNGRPHIAYYDNQGHAINHAAFDGSAWSIETAVDDTLATRDLAMAIDPVDALHVAFINQHDGILRHAENSGGAWTIEKVDGGNGGEKARDLPGLAIRSDGEILIGYQVADVDADAGEIRIATGRTGLWNFETAEDLGFEAAYHSRSTKLAVGADGHAYLIYTHQSASGTVMTARLLTDATGVWTGEPVGTVTSSTFDLSVDADGFTHLTQVNSYKGVFTGPIGPASGRAESWTSREINTGAAPRTPVDSAGLVHVLYANAGALRHAQFPLDGP
ncbi:MAG: hypothetical protein M5R36_12430 [Deltaproteobacteria bacterium]|nr:hypothetical protein [Deltaproteobacteria bacterium]